MVGVRSQVFCGTSRERRRAPGFGPGHLADPLYAGCGRGGFGVLESEEWLRAGPWGWTEARRGGHRKGEDGEHGGNKGQKA